MKKAWLKYKRKAKLVDMENARRAGKHPSKMRALDVLFPKGPKSKSPSASRSQAYARAKVRHR